MKKINSSNCCLIQALCEKESEALSANWLYDIEHDVWEAVQRGSWESKSAGLIDASAYAEGVKLIADAIDGWVDSDGFVPMNEWLKRHKEWLNKK